MWPDFPDGIEDGGSIDEGLAERSESERKVGVLLERPRRENHSVPGIGIEGVNMDSVKLGCAPVCLGSRHRRSRDQQKSATEKQRHARDLSAGQPLHMDSSLLRKAIVRSLPFVY
jgi:hypothetical protein